MSKRVLVVIDRGMVDKTAKIVWEHEIVILEAIHGEGTVRRVDPEDLDKMPMIQYGLGEPFKCANPRDEYVRMEAIYGMHPDVKMSNVEYCYGRYDEGRFIEAIGRDCVAKDEFDTMSTADMLVQSVENGFWEPKLRTKYFSIEAIVKAAHAQGLVKKSGLRESIIALMREKLDSPVERVAA